VTHRIATLTRRARARRAGLLVSLACLLCLALAPPAGAQPGNAAAAETLFQEGMELLKAKRHAEACPKLAESHRLDPGTGVLLYLGDCYAAIDKTASAWAAYQEALPRAKSEGNAVRQQAAEAGIAAMTPRLLKVQVEVPAASRVEGLQVRRDGVELQPAAWGSAIPLDPGEHVVAASAPGKQPFRAVVTLTEGTSPPVTTVTVALVDTAGAAEPAPPVAPPPPAAVPVAPGPEPPGDEGDGLTGMQTTGLILGGVGVAAVVVAAITGVMVLGERSTIDDECDETARTCSQAGLDAIDSQDTLGVVNTVAWGVGIAGLGAGLVLFLVGGDDEGTEQAFVPLVGPDGAGGVVRLRF